MRTLRAAVFKATALAMGLLATSPARAVLIGNAQGGTDFPQGAASFADVVVDYSPVISNGEPTDLNRQADRALGVPDYESGGGCWNASIPCTFVSLGDGGSITLRFVDNLLTGSDSTELDLWIFEVGPDIEDTFVELSSDGATWHAVGKVYGSTAGIDIDAFGFDASRSFSFIRLTDDPNEDDQFGMSVGADIDAVGAISTRIIPEPACSILLTLSVFALLLQRRTKSCESILGAFFARGARRLTFVLLAIVSAVLGVVTSADAVTVLTERFDYDDLTALKAEWNAGGDTVDYLLDPTFGNPSPSYSMPSPASSIPADRLARNLGGTFVGSDERPLEFTFDIYLDPEGAATNWANARHYVELRGHEGSAYGIGSLRTLLALGMYNSSDQIGDIGNEQWYSARVTSGLGGWGFLNEEQAAPQRSTGWHQLKAVVKSTQISFFVDDTLAETRERPNSFGYDSVVLGSGLTAGGHTVWVDNLHVAVVPEPASAVLLEIGMVLLLRRQLAGWTKVVALLGLAMMTTLQAKAESIHWQNTTSDGQFGNPVNWNPSDRAPVSLDIAIFDQRLGDAGDPINSVGVPHGTVVNTLKLAGATIVDLSIGDGTTASTFHVTNQTESLIVGDDDLDPATLNLLSGALDANQVKIGGSAVLDVAGAGTLSVQGAIQALGRLIVHGVPTEHASSVEEPPPTCTNGDCSPPPTCTNGDCTPPPTCTNGDCTPPPICTNGDCSPPPVCTNGDCSTVPETSNVLAQSISVAGELLLDGGHVAMPLDGGFLEIAEAGRLAGSGRIGGDVVSAGLIEPGLSAGWFLIDGDLTQTSVGRLVLEIASHSQYDRLVVRGVADMGGTLEIVLRDGYLPSRQSVFTLIDAHNPDFHFDEILVVGGPLDLRFTPQGLFGAGVPEPATVTFVAVVMFFLSVLRLTPLHNGVGTGSRRSCCNEGV